MLFLDNFETKCKPGTSRPAGDGCNTCICIEGEAWACTEMACEPDKGNQNVRKIPHFKHHIKIVGTSYNIREGFKKKVINDPR